MKRSPINQVYRWTRGSVFFRIHIHLLTCWRARKAESHLIHLHFLCKLWSLSRVGRRQSQQGQQTQAPWCMTTINAGEEARAIRKRQSPANFRRALSPPSCMLSIRRRRKINSANFIWASLSPSFHLRVCSHLRTRQRSCSAINHRVALKIPLKFCLTPPDVRARYPELRVEWNIFNRPLLWTGREGLINIFLGTREGLNGCLGHLSLSSCWLDLGVSGIIPWCIRCWGRRSTQGCCFKHLY